MCIRDRRLNVEQAVQVALLNNKGLQADFYNLGISESDLVQAGRLPNPKFSMLYTRNDGDYKIEQILTFNIFSLLTMPKMQEIERQRFVQTQKRTAFEVIKIANHTRIAYFNAVAATEQVRYSEQVKESAEASAELARRMVKAGNFNKLQQAREQSFYACLLYTSRYLFYCRYCTNKSQTISSLLVLDNYHCHYNCRYNLG